jgi:plastocyanin
LIRLGLFLALTVLISACTTRIETIREIEVTREVMVGGEQATSPPAKPRELTVLVGAGVDTVAVNAFLPSQVTIRAGDTIMWELNHPEEFHTTVFFSGEERPPVFVPVPGGGPNELQVNQKLAFPTSGPTKPPELYDGTRFYGSGIMYNFPAGPPGVPPNYDLRLTFTKPGTYEYLCVLHPPMKGTVTVVGTNDPDVPTQAEINAQAKVEEDALKAEIQRLVDAGSIARSELGPGDTTIWHVQAGAAGDPPTAQAFDFLPGDITVEEGDTIIWTSVMFHNVTFHPGRLAPDLLAQISSENVPRVFTLNPETAFPVKPSGEFDGTGFWSSGIIGNDFAPLPGGKSFAMTFSKPGSYRYVCAVHRVLGMEGTVTVVPKS